MKKVAIITGSSGKIGGEIACQLAKQGMDLILIDKCYPPDSFLVNGCIDTSSIDITHIIEDLGDPLCFGRISKKIREKYYSVDYIINNAAFYDDIPGWGVPFELESFAAWQKVLAVNLMAPFFLVQHCYPFLRESKAPSVINISSIYGIAAPDWSLYSGTDMTNPASYAASKGGLIQLTKWLSTSLAPHIRVNSISPGGILRGQPQSFLEKYLEKTPLKRMGVELDVAHAVSYLISDASSYMTGHNLVIDGGWTV